MSQQNCQKAKVNPSGPWALSPLKLESVVWISSLEKASSRSPALTLSTKENDNSEMLSLQSHVSEKIFWNALTTPFFISVSSVNFLPSTVIENKKFLLRM